MSFSLIENRNIQRGDIFTFDFGHAKGSTQTGVRPAVVVQGDFLNKKSPTTIIAPITTSMKRVTMRSHIVIGKKYGLRDESMILLEQIRVVNKTELFEYIGSINDTDILFQIDEGIKSVFGIKNRRYVQTDIKKLCSDCFERLVRKNNSIVKRVDSFDKKRYLCDCCGNTGNRYFVIPKQERVKSVSSMRINDESSNHISNGGGSNE